MANRYWVGGTGNWSDTTHWSTTSGGASGAAAPTAADDVFFDANSGTGTATVNGARTIDSLDCTGYTGTIAVSNVLTIDGTSDVLKLAAGMTWTNTAGVEINTAGVVTITSAGKTFGGLTHTQGGVTFADAFTMSSTSTYTHAAGTLTLGTANHTFGHYSSTGASGRSIACGASGKLTIQGGWTTSGSNWTITCASGSYTLEWAGNFNTWAAGGFNFSGTSNNITLSIPGPFSNTISGANSTFGPVTVAGGGTSGGITVSNNMTFNRLTWGAAQQTLTLTGITLTLPHATTPLDVQGISASQRFRILNGTLSMQTGGTAVTIAVPYGHISGNTATRFDAGHITKATISPQRTGTTTGWSYEWAAAIADTLGATDTRSIGYGRLPGDQIGITDAVDTTPPPIERFPADLVGLADTVARALARTINDDVALLDQGDALLVHDEALGILDAVEALMARNRSFTEAVAIVDACVAVIVKLNDQADTVGLTDQVTYTLVEAQHYTRTIADVLSITDAVTAAGGSAPTVRLSVEAQHLVELVVDAYAAITLQIREDQSA